MSRKLMNRVTGNDVIKLTCWPAGEGGGVTFLHKLLIHPELPCLFIYAQNNNNL